MKNRKQGSQGTNVDRNRLRPGNEPQNFVESRDTPRGAVEIQASAKTGDLLYCGAG